jgi:hypothetical protein
MWYNNNTTQQEFVYVNFFKASEENVPAEHIPDIGFPLVSIFQEIFCILGF